MTQYRDIKRILIVDDLAADRLLIRAALGRTGDPTRFEITEAETMQGAVQAVASTNPDVILLDLMLPDSRGADTVARMRAATTAAIVVLTVETDEELALQSLGVGAHEYLLKSELRTHPLDRAITYAIERKRAEQQLEKVLSDKHAMEVGLLESQKFAAVGQLAGGVAHDFNNLLTIITGVIGMLCDEEVTPEKKSMLGEVQRAADRAAALTRQLLTFAQRRVMQPQPLDLNEVLMAFRPVIAGISGEAIDLDLRLSASGPTVHADRAQLEEAILNLTLNARDAMNRRGTLTVSTDVRDVSAGELDVDLHAGRYAVVSIRDTGIGMNEDVKARAFEPFFTTYRDRMSRGLGLSAVHGFVRQSGGNVSIHSAEGHGTTVEIYLPFHASGATRESDVAVPRAVSAKTILMVEDEPSLRNLLVRALRRAGHTVLTASNGEEALAANESRVETIDLLITDLVMPRMHGDELAKRLRSIRSDLPILFISGYSSEMLEGEGLLPSGYVLLEKPFTISDFLKRIDDVLARTG